MYIVGEILIWGKKGMYRNEEGNLIMLSDWEGRLCLLRGWKKKKHLADLVSNEMISFDLSCNLLKYLVLFLSQAIEINVYFDFFTLDLLRGNRCCGHPRYEN